MKKMNVQIHQRGLKIWPSVEFCSQTLMVVFLGPIAHQVFDVAQGYALTPVLGGFFVRPARLAQTLFEVADRLFADGYGVGTDIAHGASCIRWLKRSADMAAVHHEDRTGHIAGCIAGQQ